MATEASLTTGAGEFVEPAVRFLVESALREVRRRCGSRLPSSRKEWVEHLCDTLVSDSETSHRSAFAALLSAGVSSDEIGEVFVPAAARRLGELWIQDRLSFVDVTVGANRLQTFTRERIPNGPVDCGKSIPLGQSFLMVVPTFEDHCLGGFVAAGQLRKYGVWVHMGVGLSKTELVALVGTGRFSAVGFSAATWKTVEHLAEVVDYLRSNLQDVPPLAVGGRAVKNPMQVIRQTGADFAVRTAREVVEKCGLAVIEPSQGLLLTE